MAWGLCFIQNAGCASGSDTSGSCSILLIFITKGICVRVRVASLKLALELVLESRILICREWV